MDAWTAVKENATPDGLWGYKFYAHAAIFRQALIYFCKAVVYICKDVLYFCKSDVLLSKLIETHFTYHHLNHSFTK